MLVSVTSDCPYAFPALYHAQGLIPEELLELKATNKIYESTEAGVRNFSVIQNVQTLLHPAPPPPFKG